jgi:hypothetical protein
LEEEVMVLRKFAALVPAIALIAAAIFPWSLARAQAVSLQEQLAAQYKVAKVGSDTGGYSVVEAGTLLAIQKGGILGVPYADQNALSSMYEDGKVHGPSGLALMGRKSIMGRFGKEQTTHLFAVGDKVYPTKIDVNAAKDTVAMTIVACDTCNKTDPPTYNKAQIVFKFPSGTLAKASAGGVEDVIGQLLSITDDTQQSADQGSGQQQGGQQQAAQPQQAAQQPQSIQLGQTPDQVQAALGQPDKTVDLGVKKIYVYKDLKVTFVNGKVSDVQ